MDRIELPTTAGRLGAHFGAELWGDPQAPVLRLSALSRAKAGSLSFLSEGQYSEQLKNAHGSVVLTRSEWASKGTGITFLIVPDPRGSFAQFSRRASPLSWAGMSPQTGLISETAEIHPTAQIAPGCFIGPGARVGARTMVAPFAYIGAEVQIGEDCEIHPHATLYDGVRLGNRVQIFAGAIIGSAGFGYFRQGESGPYTEMPHVGTVVLEDDVRVGANGTVDRATLEETHVSRGVKLDDHAHIAHNAQVGENCIMCAMAVVGGSTVVEKDVVFGGQVGIGPGLRIGEGARFGGQSGTTTNVPRGLETYFFNPVTPIRDFARAYRAMRKLPKLFERVRQLEKQQQGEKKDA